MIPQFKILGMFGCSFIMKKLKNPPSNMMISGYFTNIGNIYQISRTGSLLGGDFINEQELNHFISNWNRREKLKEIKQKLMKLKNENEN